MNGISFVMSRGVLLMLVGLLVCAGCQSSRLAPGTAVPSPSQEEPTGVTGVLLRPGLTVTVQVLVTGHKEIEEKNRRISESGIITLPLIGDVHVANLSIPETQALLKTSYI